MKRILAFGLLLGVAALVAVAAPASHIEAGASKDAYYTGGFWTPSKNGPFAVMNGGNEQHAFLGMMRSPNSKGCEFAISVDKAGVQFQIMDEAGNFHHLPATALLKLRDTATADKPKSSDAPVPPPAAAAADDDGVPSGHRFLYAVARGKAAAEYAKANKISLREANKKVDQLSDKTLHAAVQASGSFKISAKPVGGKLSDFLDWILAHQDQIAALVKLIISLLAFINADVDNSAIFMPHDWCGMLVAATA